MNTDIPDGLGERALVRATTAVEPSNEFVMSEALVSIAASLIRIANTLDEVWDLDHEAIRTVAA